MPAMITLPVDAGISAAVSAALVAKVRAGASITIADDPMPQARGKPGTFIVPPAIGEFWDDEGGLYAGISRGLDGAPDDHLIVTQEGQTKISWQDAMNWAGNLTLDGNRDWTLPTRANLALLYANLKQDFDPQWYWTSEEFAGDASYAWCQYFDYGYQDGHHKGNELRARAVRRIPIR